MPRYFFHLHECGNVTIDEDGRELADVATVRKKALADARAIMAAELSVGRLCLSCRIEVEDDRGASVLILPFRDAVAISGL